MSTDVRTPVPFSVVPEEHRWLSAMFAAMLRVGIPVRDAVLGDRTLRITVAPPREPPLSMVVRPVSAGLPGWKATDKFVLGYDGVRNLSGTQERHLEFYFRVLLKFEPHMPPDLEGFASIGAKEESPGRTLEKFFPFITIERSRASEQAGSIVEVMVRTTSKCNQFCPFCSAPQHDNPSEEVLCACFEHVSEMMPGAMVSLTGGEPTLRDTFFAEVEKAVSLPGIRLVQVQTNAVGFGSKLDPADLTPSGKLTFFVSLHALDPEIYDRCTKTRGQLERALEGARRILAAGHPVTLNTVVNKVNLDHLDDMVRGLPEVFPEDPRPSLHFSVLICPEWNPEAADYLVRYSEVVPALDRAAQSARKLGMDVDSLLSSTHASMPPCLVGEEHRISGRHVPEIGAHETGYEDFDRPWVKAAACAGCSEDRRCLGVPRPYAERFGLSELTPLTPLSGG